MYLAISHQTRKSKKKEETNKPMQPTLNWKTEELNKENEKKEVKEEKKHSRQARW